MSTSHRKSNDSGDSGGSPERKTVERWWENYAVRYFVGTVVGAVVISALLSSGHLHCEFRKVLPSFDSMGWQLTAIGALGLAFCYVASAPVLTLHAIRGALQFSAPEASRSGFISAALIGAIMVSAGIFAAFCGSPRGIAISLFVLVVLPQILLLAWSYFRAFDKIHDFYKNLVEARYRDWKEERDFRESYSHLREHGNAMSIVILEIVLGVILAQARSETEVVLLLLLWLSPAAGCWVVGTALEARFADREQST